MIPHVVSTLRRTASITVERPRAALWTLLALASALFAVGIAAVAAVSVDRWAATRPSSTASMVVYLGEGVTEESARALAAELARVRGVERAELVPAAESAARLVRALGNDVALLDGVDVAALPASVEVTLVEGVRDVVALSPTVRALRGTPGVADVVVEPAGGDRVVGEERVAGVLATVRTLAWVGAGLFSGLALIVVLAAIRVRLDRGGRAYAVAQLLGAGPGFLVVPTALAGALSGALAALVAGGAVMVAVHRYGGEVSAALAGSLGPIDTLAPGPAHLALFVGLGALLGLVGGGLAGAARVAR